MHHSPSRILISLASLFIFCLMFSNASAQEILGDLQYNSALHFEKPLGQMRSTDTLVLPFIEDFSYSTLDPNHKYPDQNLWLDNDVFVNTTYPVLPPSIGVATFDGLNENGVPYNIFSTTLPSPADTLTSHPIHMETISPTDTTVYFSFYYEKMGIGDYPNTGDKLILEFRKSDGTWNEEWQMDGDASAPSNVHFSQVMIHINDVSYFHNAFQFRFRNLAMISGNNDHWHIDYVRLDNGRSVGDTVLQDVAAVYTPGSPLKNYQFMPWTQFRNNQSQELAVDFPFTVRNNNPVTMNTASQYFAEEYFTATNFFTSSQTAFNFSANSNSTQNNPTFNITPIPPDDSALVFIKCKATATPDDLRRNDSAYRVQPFYNYYAHDDGSAEKSYGLYGAGSKLAYKFFANVPDTLRALQIHFAHIQDDLSNKFFSVMLWKKVLPNEEILYEQDFLHPTYIDSINGFATFILDTPQAITDTFYVGMLQTYPDILNVGLDRNTDSHQFLYYKTPANTTFVQGQLSGSVMIRPMVGARLPWTAIHHVASKTISVNLYPNPVSDVIHIDVNGARNAEITITDLTGRIVHRTEGLSENIFVGNFAGGMYLITVKDKQTKQIFTTRFIKQ